MKRLCVFCGSQDGRDPEYLRVAHTLGSTMAARGVDLVYGGAHVGLMGAAADAVLAGGGRVYGVIPHSMMEKELAHPDLTRLDVVSSMHERKQRMHDLSDAFCALPGGWGTLDEVFEALTWRQIGVHDKPVALLDHAGYYAPLLAAMTHMVDEGFVRASQQEGVLVATEVDELLDVLEAGCAARARDGGAGAADGGGDATGGRDASVSQP